MNLIKMRIVQHSLLIFSLICAHVMAFSQNPQPYSVIPSSPISKSFERYGDYPVSHVTGLPEINIPIYEIVSGDIVIPISISYHASGIKMTDVSYPVGLGWTLNAGGRVSRTVNDKPDEQSIGIGNYIGTTTQGMQTATQLMESTDNESDLFYYNLGTKEGNSGKFLFDGVDTHTHNNTFTTPVFFPASDMKFLYNNNNSLELTDEQGKKFSFAYREFTAANNFNYPSAWLLSEIMPSNKQASDKVSFSYQSGPTIVNPLLEGAMTIYDSAFIKGQIFVSQQGSTSIFSRFLDNTNVYQAGFWSLAGPLNITVPNTYNNPQHPYKRINETDPNINAYMSNYDPNNSTTHQGFLTHGYPEYSSSNISGIQFKGGHVDFIYNTAGTFLVQIKVYNATTLIKTVNFYNSTYNSWNRVKLDRIEISNSNNTQREKYSFDYEGGIEQEHPAYLNLYNARDHWNYYNGEVYNTTPVPRWTGIPTVVATNSISTNGSGSFWTVEHTRYADVEIGTANRETNEQYLKKYMLKKITFPTGGYSEFEFEANKYKVIDPVTGNPVLKDIGGLRVKKIKSFNGISNPLFKEYTYGISENDITGAGIAYNVPTYDDYVSDCFSLFPDFGDVDPNNPLTSNINWSPNPTDIYARKRDLLSTPVNPLVHIDGNPVWYTFVEEKQKDEAGNALGKTTYKYVLPRPNDQDFYLSQTASSFLQTKYTYARWSYNTPLLQQKKIYKYANNDYQILQSQNYGLVEQQYLPSFSVKMYPWKTVCRFIGYPYINYDKRYDDVETAVEYVYPMAFFSNSEVVTDYSYTDNNTVLSSTSSTNYIYNTAAHTKPKEITTTNSTGGTIVKKITYPTDYTNLTGQDDLTRGIKNLQVSNIISVPIEQITTVSDANQTNSRVIAASFTTYKPTEPFVNKVYAPEINNPLSTFAPTAVVSGSIVLNPLHKLKLQADNYNQEGDITEQHIADNIHTAYLWGYNKMYPVAQVVGATSSAINGLVNQAVLDNPSSTDLQIRTELNNLRTGLANTKALITTYTYKPLIGMTSQTDPNNRTTYYEYDELNRLTVIRDKDLNVIKKICYNYAGQVEDCVSPCTIFTPNWQNTTTALRCQQGTCGNTGYQEQEQVDINPCTNYPPRWIEAGYNPAVCAIGTCVNLTSTNTYNTSGYTASYYNNNTGITYPFTVSTASGLQPLGTIPEGNYTLAITRSSGNLNAVFKSGCFKQIITGTSATFYNVNVSATTCNSITVTFGAEF